MKKIVLFLLLCGSLFAQEENLKGLNKVFVNVRTFGILSDKLQNQLTMELKLKLLGAGVQTAQTYEDSKASLDFSVDLIKSAFADERVLIIMKLIEPVIIKREKNINTRAITYYDYKFFTAPQNQVPDFVYDKILNVMFVSFINKCLTDNSK